MVCWLWPILNCHFLKPEFFCLFIFPGLVCTQPPPKNLSLSREQDLSLLFQQQQNTEQCRAYANKYCCFLLLFIYSLVANQCIPNQTKITRFRIQRAVQSNIIGAEDRLHLEVKAISSPWKQMKCLICAAYLKLFLAGNDVLAFCKWQKLRCLDHLTLHTGESWAEHVNCSG